MQKWPDDEAPIVRPTPQPIDRTRGIDDRLLSSRSIDRLMPSMQGRLGVRRSHSFGWEAAAVAPTSQQRLLARSSRPLGAAPARRSPFSGLGMGRASQQDLAMRRWLWIQIGGSIDIDQRTLRAIGAICLSSAKLCGRRRTAASVNRLTKNRRRHDRHNLHHRSLSTRFFLGLTDR